MKHVILLVLGFATLVAAVDQKPAAVKQMEEDMVSCQSSESASKADVDQFNKNETPATYAGKCFVGCMFERMGFIVNGVYSRSAADAHANSHMSNNQTLLALVLKSNQLCETELKTTTDKCITGPKLLKCLMKNLPSQQPTL